MDYGLFLVAVGNLANYSGHPVFDTLNYELKDFVRATFYWWHLVDSDKVEDTRVLPAPFRHY